MKSSFIRSVGLAVAASVIISSTGVATSELPSTGPGFGDYELVPLLDDGVAYAGPATPTSLDEVRVSRLVEAQLPAGARERLAEQGFVVVPSGLRLFHEAYADQYASGTPVFVTTDAAYHAWHLVFDKILRDVEQKRLLPTLEQLVLDMRQNAVSQRRELAGSALAADAARVVDLLTVTADVLGLRSGKLSARAAAERRLIAEHSQYIVSPVLGTKVDYSLFTPRGHYTRNEDLARYFVAMSVLGQHAFYLPGSQMPGGGTLPDPTSGLRRAILASRTLVGHPELEAMWRQVFEPTAFLVGVSDDYTPFELQTAVEATVPGAWGDPSMVADDGAILAIAENLAAAREVRIDPERPSVRLMGTRFVLDSWILDQMVGPNVGTQADPRVFGSPLDIAAAFGSDFALAIQEAAGETAKANYPEQMAAMRTAVAARPDEAWGTTVYDAWLAAVEPTWLPRGEAFPDFMRRDAWATKSQQTGFGSYAELKHDTILYTKQAGGDTGGGPEPRPARNWVEPDPVPFGRLSAVAALTRAGLDDRGLLPREQRQVLDLYIDMVDRLARIATDELAGEPISEEDNGWLRSIGGELSTVWALTGDSPDRNRPAELDMDAAIIADIMRGVDTMAGTDEVLEIGTGYVDRIYVIVPDDTGRFHVASGGVYSYYEFRWPTPDRLTDETWRKMLRNGEAPERPAWQGELFADPGAIEEPRPDPTPRPSRRALERELGATIAGATWEPYRSSPRGVTFDPFKNGAIAAVLFDDLEQELHRAVDYVALFRFRDNDYLDGYWMWRTWDAEGAPMRTLPCADGRPGRDAWLHGEYLCYVSDDDVALVRWTDERTATYGVMNGVAGRKDLAALYEQWQEVVANG